VRVKVPTAHVIQSKVAVMRQLVGVPVTIFARLLFPLGECPHPTKMPWQKRQFLLTNLAVFAHKFRPDLQAEFPDPFDRNRLGYAAWFLRYAGYEHRLVAIFSRQLL
jgi:hypothetical protein